MKYGKEKGFTLLEGLVIIVVVALLVGGGWIVWRHQHKAASSSITSATHATKENTTAATVSNNQLTIPEWKLRATYPASLGSVSYNFEDHTAFWLVSTAAKNLPQSCGNDGTGNIGAAISRFKGNSPHSSPDASKKIGDYTYYLDLDPYGTASKCSDPVTLNSIHADYKAVFNSLEAQ